MGDPAFVGQSLVEVLPVGYEDVFMAGKPGADRHKSIEPVQVKKHKVNRVRGGDDEFAKQKNEDKSERYRSHIAGKATGTGPEIVEGKDKECNRSSIQQVIANKGDLNPVQKPEACQDRQPVPCGDAIDPVHEVEGIDGAGGHHERYDPDPGSQGAMFQLV